MIYMLFKDGQYFSEFEVLQDALDEAYRCFDDELAEVYSYNEDYEEIERIF